MSFQPTPGKLFSHQHCGSEPEDYLDVRLDGCLQQNGSFLDLYRFIIAMSYLIINLTNDRF